jgi:hypothetical protein
VARQGNLSKRTRWPVMIHPRPISILPKRSGVAVTKFAREPGLAKGLNETFGNALPFLELLILQR